MGKLSLAIVWHMHQPYYKDDLTKTYLLPWVRLRSAKDYHKMAALLDGYPGVRQTFNLVPSLLAQIEDYTTGDYQDLFLNLSRKPAAELSAEERSFIVNWLCESPRFLRVQASPRYLELAGRDPSAPFTDSEIRDIQVLANLAWCDPAWVDADPRLTALKAKERDYAEEDKEVLFGAQLEMVARVIPKYRELAERGQAELTFSPYFHPILPLLHDTSSAQEASPGMALPQTPFRHPEDALRQIECGRQTFERLLGRQPRGMWPPEMAVGPPVAEMVAQAGLDWLISDEGVLGRSLDRSLDRDGSGSPQAPELLYSAYRVQAGGREVAIVFRDALLSNMIGFDYHRMPAVEAASDFVARLKRIHDVQGDRDFLVTVALDGENAWDFYSRDGHDFLNALYTELEAASEWLDCTTVGEFLRDHAHRADLPRLHTGSWIGASLDTWIGDPEHNVAWELLSQTRDWVMERFGPDPAVSPEAAAAWREIDITEGSDWYWWFSHRHDSGMDAFWDNEFRLHLRNAYKVAGEKPPARLFQPIIKRAHATQRRVPSHPISPTGFDDPAWDDAGAYEVGSGFGALHKPVEMVERVLYGCDHSALHIRIDSPRSVEQVLAEGVEFWIYISGLPQAGVAAHEGDLQLPLGQGALADLGFEPGFVARVSARPGGAELIVARAREGAAGAEPVWSREIETPFMVSIPFEVLGKQAGEPLELALVVTRGGRDVEQVPPFGSVGVRVPENGAGDTGGPPLKVLIAAAEIAPFAKTGGVADVVAALPKQLRRQGHDARLVMPRYRQVNVERYGLQEIVRGLKVPLGAQDVECSIFLGHLDEVPVYFVDCPQLYDRDQIYGFGDDDARFVYLSRAVIEMMRAIDFIPDVVNLHDWHTALVPNLLEKLYSDDAELSRVATLLTIHNLGFQGVFTSAMLHLAGLERWGLLKTGIPHLDDVVNVLGRGIHYSDLINTVSETYAREIQTPEYGEGLDEVIRLNAHKLSGIVNGIDYDIFDPRIDPVLPHRYGPDDPTGKARNREFVRAELGLEQTGAPLITMVSRLYDPKGLDLVEQVLPALSSLDVQIAVLGAGDHRYEEVLRRHADTNRGRMAAVIGFDSRLAQLLYAGADVFLMPSRSEPCGLGQLIALRYGTIPVVRATGGLADTIHDYNPITGAGNGFTFGPYDPWQLFAALVRATETYRHREIWDRLVRRAMHQDVSWDRSARRYVQLYRGAVVAHGERHERVPAEVG